MPNKVLMISNYSNLSGYSIAAENTLKAIYYGRFPVCARNINLTPKQRPLDELTQKLLHKDASDADILLIHSLPSFFQYDGRFKLNIGYFDFELPLLGTGWKKYCELMDAVWVPSCYMADMLVREKLNKPIKIVPHPVDVNRFTKSFNKNNWFLNYKKATGHYLFYTISEFGSRKNYEGLLKAWHSHFRSSDKVELIIKSHKAGWSAEKLNEEIISLNEFVKSNLRISDKIAKNPIIITEDWSNDDIDMLHYSADCFVSATHGEAWYYPCFDAACFQKPVIISKFGGHLDFISDRNGYLVSGTFETPYCSLDLQPNLYHYEQKWFEPSPNEFGSVMRLFYKNPEEAAKKGELGQYLLNKYNYPQIGQLIKEHLETYLKK